MMVQELVESKMMLERFLVKLTTKKVFGVAKVPVLKEAFKIVFFKKFKEFFALL